MAYAATVTVTQVGASEWQVLVEETDCGAADVAVLDGIPNVGNVVRVSAQLLAGSGATINPIATLTNPPASATADGVIVIPVGTAAVSVDVTGTAQYAAVDQDGSGLGRIYHSSRCNAGADNTVRTVYRVRANHW